MFLSLWHLEPFQTGNCKPDAESSYTAPQPSSWELVKWLWWTATNHLLQISLQYHFFSSSFHIHQYTICLMWRSSFGCSNHCHSNKRRKMKWCCHPITSARLTFGVFHCLHVTFHADPLKFSSDHKRLQRLPL